ncbi:MAG: AmmeMemoRadiSam system protein B [Armatimonadota bacterium]|nr:MAG: AmmeMemoRadiSam system protein B [Armatimonadota bacterium]
MGERAVESSLVMTPGKLNLANHGSARPLASLTLVVLLVVLTGCARSTRTTASALSNASRVRPPAVAGPFYAGDAATLARQVDGYLASAKAPAKHRPVVALIAPHAGYEYCGKVAAAAYRLLQGRDISTVVVVGPSHSARFPGAALCSADAWETPLGTVPADGEIIAALATRDAFDVRDEPHGPEHCIEVQLPFLQRTVGDFRLVPVLMSDFSRENCARVGKGLAEALAGRSALLVASSDMSHYPAYDDACKADREMLDALRTFDADKVLAKDAEVMGGRTPRLACTLCGLGPVIAVMRAAKLMGADEVEILSYANSGDVVPQMRNRVVGYCAVAMYGDANASDSGAARATAKEAATMSDKPADKATQPDEGELNEEQQRKLLRLARRAIEEYVRTGKVIKVTEDDPLLNQPRGCFVTLKQGDMLRGCIGDLEGREPLYLNIRDKAIASATQDFRFEPVRHGAVQDLDIEISVLSPLRRVADPSEIVAGKHGVLVREGHRGGVYLPQVATEQGWSREEMLTHLCQYKAGLAPDAWKRGAELYSFTAQVFGEKELGE